MVKKKNVGKWIQIFIADVKADNIYKYIAEDFETRFDTSNYELNRVLLKEKNKNIISVIKD